MRRLPLVLLLVATLAHADGELIHPPGGGGAIPSLPIPMPFGGTGSPIGAFADDRCVETYLDFADLDRFGVPKLKMRSSAAPCPATSGVGGVTGVIDVTTTPYNADNMCAHDATSAINTAIAALPSGTKGTVYFPAGCYLISGPIQVRSGTNANGITAGLTLQGAGKGATLIESDDTGTGFSMVQVATPRTCTGGTGSCDARINTSGRGAGCTCYRGTDCQSATCAGGSAQRYVTIRDLGLIPRKDNMVALDAAFMGESLFENLILFDAGFASSTNTIGFLASDGNATVSGYSGTVFHVQIGGFAVCARLMPQANDFRFISTEFSPVCGTGLAIDNGVNATHVTDSMFQSTKIPVCTAGACVGGYFHGKPCTTGQDCGEADVINLGLNNQIVTTRFEDFRNAHIRCGEASTASPACPTCGAFTAQEMFVFGGYYSSDVTKGTIVETPSRCQRPLVITNDFDQTKILNHFGGGGFEQLLLEGATLNGFKTTVNATDPTANRTISFPNASGTVQLTGTAANNVLLSSDDQNATATWQISGHGKNMLYGINNLSNVTITGNTGTVALSATAPLFNGDEFGANSTFTIATAATDTVILEVTTSSGNLPTSVFNNTSGLWASAQFRAFGATPVLPGTITIDAKYDDGLGGATYHTVGTVTSNTSAFIQKALTFSPAMTGLGRIFAIRWTFSAWNTTGQNYLITAGLHHKSEQPFPMYLRRDAASTRFPMLAGIAFEGATNDDFETTLNVIDPTADRAINLPNLAGTVCVNTGGGCVAGATPTATPSVTPTPTPSPTRTLIACPTFGDWRAAMYGLDASGNPLCLATPTVTATP